MIKKSYLILALLFFATLVHTAKASQCEATTYRGTQCSRSAAVGDNYCWQHSNDKKYADSQSASASGYRKSGGNSSHYNSDPSKKTAWENFIAMMIIPTFGFSILLFIYLAVLTIHRIDLFLNKLKNLSR